jgi:hypothetical protein
MMANKAKAVKGLTGGIEMLFKKNKVCCLSLATAESVFTDLLIW